MADAEARQDARRAAKWLLSLPAMSKGANGDLRQISYGGKNLTNMELEVLALIQNGKDNPAAAMTALALGGAMEGQREIDARHEAERKAKLGQWKKDKARAERNLKNQLGSEGLYQPSMLSCVRGIATLRAVAERLQTELVTEPMILRTTSREGAERVLLNECWRQLSLMEAQIATATQRLYSLAQRFKGKTGGEADDAFGKMAENINSLLAS